MKRWRGPRGDTVPVPPGKQQEKDKREAA
jgi:hypothetical protein